MKTEQKKEYKAPQMRSVELKHQANLMAASGLNALDGRNTELG